MTKHKYQRKVKKNWELIEEVLFDLHIRFCPLVDTPGNEIKQKHCNAVKEELRKRIKALLHDFSEELIGKEESAIRELYPLPCGGMSNINVGNVERNDLRKEQRKLRDSLLGKK